MTFRIKNITFNISFYFVGLITFLLSLNVSSMVLYAIFFSIFHETGHLFFMIILGNKPKKVAFEITGMNIIRMENTKISLKNELLIALGGPFANFILFIILCFCYALNEQEILLQMASVNLILMVFNLLPVKRLDGGMALYFLLSNFKNPVYAQKFLKITSIIFILLIYIWGLYIFYVSHFNFSVLIIAFFLTLSMLGDNEY